MPWVHMSKISDKGRVQIPEQVRKALHLEDCEYVVWEERGPYHFTVHRAKITVEDLRGETPRANP